MAPTAPARPTSAAPRGQGAPSGSGRGRGGGARWTAEDEAACAELGIVQSDEGLFDDSDSDAEGDYEDEGRDGMGEGAHEGGRSALAGLLYGVGGGADDAHTQSTSAAGGAGAGTGRAPQQQGLRWFRVSDVLRAGGDFRPSFVLAGDVVETHAGEGAAACASAAPRGLQSLLAAPAPAEAVADSDAETAAAPNGAHAGGGLDVYEHAGQHADGSGSEGEGDGSGSSPVLVAAGLTLALRYEPPSPKFTRLCPRAASYRMSVRRGDDFLYSARGLAPAATYDRAAATVVWGDLRLAFAGGEAAMARFVDALKYVDLAEGDSRDKEADGRVTVRPRDGGARATAEATTQTLQLADAGAMVSRATAPPAWALAALAAAAGALTMMILRR